MVITNIFNHRGNFEFRQLLNFLSLTTLETTLLEETKNHFQINKIMEAFTFEAQKTNPLSNNSQSWFIIVTLFIEVTFILEIFFNGRQFVSCTIKNKSRHNIHNTLMHLIENCNDALFS